MTDWCILRTSARLTLGLAASLAQDGYDVWTPVEHRTVRIPRANVRRPIKLPLMPSYVFARSAHLVDLLQLAKMPVKPRRGAGLREPAHASFSILRWHEGIPLIADHSLEGLRRIEARRTPRPKAERSLLVGTSAKVGSGSFGGMTGTVERSNEKQTHICFNGRTAIIPTCLLSPDDISIQQFAA